MIFICSAENDITTNEVVKNLRLNNKAFYRFNLESDYITGLNLTDNNVTIEVNNKTIIKNPSFFWYRRGKIKFGREMNIFSEDNRSILDFLYKKTSPNFLNEFKDNFINKLKVLEIAKNNELRIPKYMITSSKKELLKFIGEVGDCCTKPLDVLPQFDFENESYEVFTNKISSSTVKSIPEKFQSSLIQEYIDKKFEIRTFYLNKKMFSIAIFSQTNVKTSIDFRQYDRETPNRCVPFKLPKSYEKKIISLFKDLELNSGSLDIIYSTKNEFVFLEVNPIGQFMQVSLPGNYDLEIELAKFISKYER